MKHPYLLFPNLLLLAGAAQAQATLSIGPTIGGNLSTLHDADANAATVNSRLGWLAGAQAAISWHNFAVQPALLFSQKGYKNEYDLTYRDSNNIPGGGIIHNNFQLSYLTLPLNFCYAPLGATTGPQLFAGPYVSVLLSARNEHTDGNHLPTDATVTDELIIAEHMEVGRTAGVRRFDAGVQGGVGYRYAAFLLQASYSLGLRTTVPAYTYQGAPVTIAGNYNRAFQLSLAYLFGDAK
jgi:hypothetical protein